MPLGALATSVETLDEVVRRGAQEMLLKALEFEIDGFVARHEHLRDKRGRNRVVRNGYARHRSILTGAGPLTINAPRARDKAGANAMDVVRFSSALLPPYLRRSKSLNELIPWLYLKGVSTGDFQDALQALLGTGAKGLSANIVVKLKEQWNVEFETWNKRDLSAKEYVYMWADGVYFNIRLDADDRQCILVVMGATKDGTKELLAVQDGHRESEQSWTELLADLKARGLKKTPPKLAIGDGALGFWAALRKVFSTTREQRCWVHKTANVLDKMPKNVQPRAKTAIHQIYLAETKKDAVKAFDTFEEKFGAKYVAATSCLKKDRDELLTFYDFPAEHWKHIRTSNPIESTFATVRLRHRRTKGNGTRQACLVMVFKLVEAAEKRWRRLDGSTLLLEVLRGTKFVDGIEQAA
ncbi:MAG: IS256 family transposase [Bdellovibrionota bacterium]